MAKGVDAQRGITAFNRDQSALVADKKRHSRALFHFGNIVE